MHLLVGAAIRAHGEHIDDQLLEKLDDRRVAEVVAPLAQRRSCSSVVACATLRASKPEGVRRKLVARASSRSARGVAGRTWLG